MSHVNVGFRDLDPDILGKHLGTLLNTAVCGLSLLLWHFVYPTVPSSQILFMVILVTPQLPVFFVVLVYSVLESFVVFLDLSYFSFQFVIFCLHVKDSALHLVNFIMQAVNHTLYLCSKLVDIVFCRQ